MPTFDDQETNAEVRSKINAAIEYVDSLEAADALTAVALASAASVGIGAARTEGALVALYSASRNLDTPHSLSAMASAPTITVSAGSGSAPSAPYAALTQAELYSAGSTKFHYAGGGDTTFSTDYRQFPVSTRISGGNVSTTTNAVAWRVTADYDAQSVSFRVLGGFTSNYRFIVDGEYVSVAGTSDGAGGRRYITLDFGSKTSRRITVEGANSMAFTGAYVAVGDTITYPKDLDTRICLILGDSFAASTGATNNRTSDGWGVIFGEALGFKNIWLSGEGGTGYVNPGANQYKLADRITDDVNRAKAVGTVAKVIIAHGLNDLDSASQIQAEANNCFDLIRTLLPNASISVLGPWDVNAPSATASGYSTAKAGIQAALAGRAGFSFLDIEGVSFTKSDGTHPDDTGHETLGNAIAALERAALGA